MAEDRHHFGKRWPHLTTLYNSSPFVTRPYKEVEEWNSLRPLPAPIGGYPPSYDDTYRDGSVFASYNPQRQTSFDKYGRNFVGAPPNYDAFSTSTYQTLPHRKEKKKTKTIHFLSCAIGVSVILALIGALAAIIIVLREGSDCDAYGDSVWVIESPYNHDKIITDTIINHNFTRDFCMEMEKAFLAYFTNKDQICGCSTGDINLVNGLPLVHFSIEYRKITDNDKNETYVGMRLATILDNVINGTEMPSFRLSYLIPPEFAVTKSPMPANGYDTVEETSGNDTAATNGTTISTGATVTGSSNSSSKPTPKNTSNDTDATKAPSSTAATSPTTPPTTPTTTATTQTTTTTTAPVTSPPTTTTTEQTTTPTAPPTTTTGAEPESPIQQAPPVTTEPLPALPTTNDIATTSAATASASPVIETGSNIVPPPVPNAYVSDSSQPDAPGPGASGPVNSGANASATV